MYTHEYILHDANWNVKEEFSYFNCFLFDKDGHLCYIMFEI